MNRTSAPANVAVERGDPLLRLFTFTPILLIETSSSVLLIRRVGFGSLLLVSALEHRGTPATRAHPTIAVRDDCRREDAEEADDAHDERGANRDCGVP